MVGVALVVGCYCGLKSSLHWRLCFIDALLVGSDRKLIVGWCYHRFLHSPSRITPLGWRRMTVRGPGCSGGVPISFKGGHRFW
jgi:hypothetical protein